MEKIKYTFLSALLFLITSCTKDDCYCVETTVYTNNTYEQYGYWTSNCYPGVYIENGWNYTQTIDCR